MPLNKEINDLVNAYCRLRDRQRAVYDRCARQHGLTVNELFVLDILWFSPVGCTQKEICDRLSANKQTVAAITGRFLQKGLIIMKEVTQDRRNKRIFFTAAGKEYTRGIIPPAAEAENLAMADLGNATARELLRLTAAFTENMESQFAKIQ